MRPTKITSFDLEIAERMKSQFLTKKELKKIYGSESKVKSVIQQLSFLFPLYSEKLKKNVRYKILTDQDIKNWFENK